MPIIIAKSFLFHFDPSVNSDKVFNLFLIDNQNGSFSAISEYGRSGAKLIVKQLAVNCLYTTAQSRYADKLDEKLSHKVTPYLQTLHCSNSPTFQKLHMAEKTAAVATNTVETAAAKILDFKPTQIEIKSPAAPALIATEKESGEQPALTAAEVPKYARRTKQLGVLNLNQLDALEL